MKGRTTFGLISLESGTSVHLNLVLHYEYLTIINTSGRKLITIAWFTWKGSDSFKSSKNCLGQVGRSKRTRLFEESNIDIVIDVDIVIDIDIDIAK